LEALQAQQRAALAAQHATQQQQQPQQQQQQVGFGSPLQQYKDSYQELQLQHAFHAPLPQPEAIPDLGYAPGQTLESNAQSAAPAHPQFSQTEPHLEQEPRFSPHQPTTTAPIEMAQTQPLSQYDAAQPVPASTAAQEPSPASQTASLLAVPPPAPQPHLQQPHTPSMTDDLSAVLGRQRHATGTGTAMSLYPPPSTGDAPASPNTDPDRLIQLHDDGVQLASIKRGAPAGSSALPSPAQTTSTIAPDVTAAAVAAAASAVADDDDDEIIPISRGASAAAESLMGSAGAATATSPISSAAAGFGVTEVRGASASKNAPLSLPTAGASGTPLKRPLIIIPKRTSSNKPFGTSPGSAAPATPATASTLPPAPELQSIPPPAPTKQ
jgi:hypothetical protein